LKEKQKPKKRTKTEEEKIHRRLDSDLAFFAAVLEKGIPAIKGIYNDITKPKPSPAEVKASESQKGPDAFIKRMRGEK
jgi:hypothetical protein